MGEDQENLWVMVHKTAVFRGMRGSGPMGESGELPQMEPHYMLRLEGEQERTNCYLERWGGTGRTDEWAEVAMASLRLCQKHSDHPPLICLTASTIKGRTSPVLPWIK